MQFETNILCTLTGLWATAPLPFSVEGVVGRCAYKEVVRTDAGGIVAVVTDVQAIWNRPDLKSPCDSVGKFKHALTVAKNSIATLLPKAHPFPAPFSLLHSAPEAYGKWLPLGYIDIAMHAVAFGVHAAHATALKWTPASRNGTDWGGCPYPSPLVHSSNVNTSGAKRCAI